METFYFTNEKEFVLLFPTQFFRRETGISLNLFFKIFIELFGFPPYIGVHMNFPYGIYTN
jgi:hypothetical protein